MSPFVSIWLNPRRTVRDGSNSLSGGFQFLLIWAWGAAYALDRSMSGGRMPEWPLAAQVALPIGMGVFGGHFYVYSMAAVIGLTRSWFKGRATSRQVLQALVLGGISKIVSGIGYLVLIAMFGSAFFNDKELPDGYPPALQVSFYAVLLPTLVVAIWGVFSTAHTLAEVQGYASAWKGWFQLVVSFLILVLILGVPIMLLLVLLR